MKKRAMKKWIPKDICYCGNCKWRSLNETKDNQMNGYCKYLNLGDWYKEGTLLLWDGCKECGEHDGDKIEEIQSIRNAKWYARNPEYRDD